MRSTRRLVLVCLALILGWLSGIPAFKAEAAAPALKAAFVRQGDLWVREGEREERLTTGEFARNPRWSGDGRWIAYTRGEQERELWLRKIGEPQGRRISADAGTRFEWAPAGDRLAFQSGDRLYWIGAGRPDKPTAAASGIGRFSWRPDGRGFVASSQANLLPDGSWTPVRILNVPLAGPDGGPAPARTIYTLPARSGDFFAVGTSLFKWSADGRWMAFLATPTASLSADDNTLCVLSADGSTFQRIDRMANDQSWFEWAGEGDELAYIAGIGREATTNKTLRVAKIPLGKPASYTPAGYVDQGFAWEGPKRIVASRAKEQAQWTAASSARPFPFLVGIGLNDRRQKRLTPKSRTMGDYGPVYLPAQRTLTWVRSDRKTANVFVADPDGRGAKEWIRSLDLGPNFYEQWNWGAVLQFYKGEAAG